MKAMLTAMFLLATLGVQVLAISQQPTDVTTAPVLINDVKPSYTPEAMRKNRQGRVGLVLTVKPDGSVGKVRVTQRLSRELDAAAVKAAKQWRFKPGTKNGKPVPVKTDAEMTFTLR
jgi:protein TonB